MSRLKWILLVIVLAVASFSLARFGAPWLKFLVSRDGPPPGVVLPNLSFIVPDEGAVRYDRGQTLPPPDQPGWRGRPGNEYFGLPFKEFVVAARRTANLGRPEGSGDLRTLPPFVLAALPWMATDNPEKHPIITLSKVAQLLRAQKIVAFGNPMALSYPLLAFKGDFWKNPNQVVWLGIPVPPGTEVKKPLVLKEFPGGDVVMATDSFTTISEDEDWGSLQAKARTIGRETTMPLIHRFQGWTLDSAGVRVQRMLPLKP